jgi:UTP:GlnB (protein PII) uridylyltransferase
MGNLSDVLKQLSNERKRLEDELHRVTAALTAFGNVYLHGGSKKRTLSPAGRERIAAAQRARWAKMKAMPQIELSKPKRTMSASAPRKIAAAQRARWAKVKKAA